MKTILSAMFFLTILFVSKAQNKKEPVSQEWHLATYVKTEFEKVSIPQSSGVLVSSDTIQGDGMDYLNLLNNQYRLNIGDNLTKGNYVLTKNTLTLGNETYDIESVERKYMVLSKEEYYPGSQLKIVTKIFLYR